MEIEVYEDEAEAAARAADLIAHDARLAIDAGRCFSMAVSGGTTPEAMLADLGRRQLLWERVHVFQVDERVAPEGHPERNLSSLRANLLDLAPIPDANAHPMPVEEDDLAAAAKRYAGELEAVCGVPARLDLVHLGLGADGHTASLPPEDPVLEVRDRDVALTRYRRRARMTFTLPLINRAKSILWLVLGNDKREAVRRVLDSDSTTPAARVRRDRARLILDRAAGQSLEPS